MFKSFELEIERYFSLLIFCHITKIITPGGYVKKDLIFDKSKFKQNFYHLIG